MMKNFVKLLVIAMAPVVLTSGVQATKKEVTLADKQKELSAMMPTYYSNTFAVYGSTMRKARELQETLKAVADKKMANVSEYRQINDLLTSLQGKKLGYTDPEWLFGRLATSTEKTLNANILNLVWNKIAGLSLISRLNEQEEADLFKEKKAGKVYPRTTLTITYYTTKWTDEGNTRTIAIAKDAKEVVKPTEVVAKTYGDLTALWSALWYADKKAIADAKKAGKFETMTTAIPTDMLPLFEQLAKVDFYSPIADLANKARMVDQAGHSAYVFEIVDKIIELKAEIAELEKGEAAAPKYLATSLNILLKDE